MAAGFTWTDFQPEPSILDPFRTIFDVLCPTWKSGLGQSVAWRAKTRPGHPQPGLPIPELFSGPHSGTFFFTFFVAFLGNSSNNVDPADPTKFEAFPGNSTNNVDKKPDLAFLAKPPQEKVSKPAGDCLLYTSPSPRDQRGSRMPSSA